MARKKFTEDQIAQILVEMTFLGDKETADKYRISGETLRRWSKQAEINPQLLKLMEIKKRAFQRRWVDEAGAFIGQAFTYLHQAAQTRNQSPELIHAIAGALKIASEIVTIREVLDARLSGQDRENASED